MFWRVQVKYAGEIAKTSGAHLVKLKRNSRSQGAVRSYTEDETDIVVAYIPMTQDILWLPPELFLDRSYLSFQYKEKTTSIFPTIRYVEDYLFK